MKRARKAAEAYRKAARPEKGRSGEGRSTDEPAAGEPSGTGGATGADSATNTAGNSGAGDVGSSGVGAGAGGGNQTEERVHGLLKGGGGESGTQKAAKFLLLLSRDDATSILKHMTPEEVERIAIEIARIKRIGIDDARKTLEEFGKLTRRGASVRGGSDVARQMLVGAFGREKGERIFTKAVPTGIDNPFDFLDELDFQQILMVLKHEPASVVSVVLPYLDPQRAAEVLEAFHPELQRAVARRIANLQTISPEVLQRVAEALKERIRRQGKVITEEVDGPSVLAEILRYTNVDRENEILDDLDSYNPDLTEVIRDKLLTFDVIFRIRDQDLQMILRDFSETEIATILKGKNEESRNRILSSISSRRASLVQEEMEHLGPMKRSDVDQATREFLFYIRDLEQEGKLVIDEQDEYVLR